MFAEIAPSYDLVNGLMSGWLHRNWRQAVVRELHLKQGDHVVDGCCGTGDFFVPLRKAVGTSGQIVGFDFCEPMLNLAAPKDAGATRLLADACRTPLASEYFHAMTIGWGIRNVPDIDGAHREAFRVLRPGGTFASLDMAKPANRFVRAVSEFVFHRVIPKIGTLFGKTEAYTYLPESTERFMTREQLRTSMESAGFVDVRTRDFMMGNICMHIGRRP